MIRKAFVMSVHPGQEAEYARRHQPIWTELAAVLKAHGAHNYSIFLHPETRQLFGTVGMFMVVVGGLLLHTLLNTVPSPEVVLWSGVQKTGAFGAVGIGVLNGVFSPLALLVAFFDLATAVLLFIYWRRLGAAAPAGLTP